MPPVWAQVPVWTCHGNTPPAVAPERVSVAWVPASLIGRTVVEPTTVLPFFDISVPCQVVKPCTLDDDDDADEPRGPPPCMPGVAQAAATTTDASAAERAMERSMDRSPDEG